MANTYSSAFVDPTELTTGRPRSYLYASTLNDLAQTLNFAHADGVGQSTLVNEDFGAQLQWTAASSGGAKTLHCRWYPCVGSDDHLTVRCEVNATLSAGGTATVHLDSQYGADSQSVAIAAGAAAANYVIASTTIADGGNGFEALTLHSTVTAGQLDIYRVTITVNVPASPLAAGVVGGITYDFEPCGVGHYGAADEPVGWPIEQAALQNMRELATRPRQHACRSGIYNTDANGSQSFLEHPHYSPLFVPFGSFENGLEYNYAIRAASDSVSTTYIRLLHAFGLEGMRFSVTETSIAALTATQVYTGTFTMDDSRLRTWGGLPGHFGLVGLHPGSSDLAGRTTAPIESMSVWSAAT